MSQQSSIKTVLYLVHLDSVLKLYEIVHAALLGQFALFQTKCCMEQVVKYQMSTMTHKKPKQILNGSCKIKIKNSCIQTESTENAYDLHVCL